jgi:hypothetical protein
MALDRLATAQRKTEAARARLNRVVRELREATEAVEAAETAEEYAAAHPLLAEPVLTEGVAE